MFGGVFGSPYVNASLVSPSLFSFPCPAYIACQAPLPALIADFWHVVWEQGVQVVVMLTREKERWKGGEDSFVRKADRYWPEEEEEGEVQVGRLSIACHRTDAAQDNFVVRHFRLRLRGGGEGEEEGGEEEREVVHLHYVGWPDHGVPPSVSSFADFFSAYRRLRGGPIPPAPVVVHCSAGIGRTGTFIAIDLLLHHIAHLHHTHLLHSHEQQQPPAHSLHLPSSSPSSSPSDDSSACSTSAALPPLSVSVLNTVRLLRQSRPGMVQTKGQYQFIYTFIAHALQHRLYTQPSPVEQSGAEEEEVEVEVDGVPSLPNP